MPLLFLLIIFCLSVVFNVVQECFSVQVLIYVGVTKSVCFLLIVLFFCLICVWRVIFKVTLPFRQRVYVLLSNRGTVHDILWQLCLLWWFHYIINVVPCMIEMLVLFL